MDFSIRMALGAAAARATVLKRVPLDEETLSPALKRSIARIFGRELSPSEAVRQIIADVRAQGDAALLRYTADIDGVQLKGLEVERQRFTEAYSAVGPDLVAALKLAAARVRSFHLRSVRQGWMDRQEGGLGQLIRPLQRVGAYVPGGTASYPSTVLMTAIPARVAGVEEIIVVTPPQRSGEVHPATLVAADICGVDRVFSIGGAQAIAALAYGTASVPRVDKICGPGNIFVQLAKQQVFGAVGVDGIYGPTETVIVADDSADPALCAADLLAQAEHDPLASAILITPSPGLAARVGEEMERQLDSLQRREIAAASLAERGGIAIVDSLEQAVALASEYAPEHLSLVARDAWRYLDAVKNAGGVFIGESSPEVLADYVSGPSHVMPTGGAARFTSPLNVDHFLKVISVAGLDEATLNRVGPAAARIARAEGLDAHALAVEKRLEKQGRQGRQ